MRIKLYRRLRAYKRYVQCALVVTCGLYLFARLLAAWYHRHACVMKHLHDPWKTFDDILESGGSILKRNQSLNDVIWDVLHLSVVSYDLGLDPTNQEGKTFFLIQPRVPLDKFDDLTLLVLVHSSASRVDERDLIRQTWGNHSIFQNANYLKLFVVFVIGLPPPKYFQYNTKLKGVITESNKHGDILLVNAMDTYNNLTYKGWLGMTWAATLGPTVNYIFKTDDDILLNTFSWFEVVEQVQSHNIKCCIVGNVWLKPEVIRYDRSLVTEEEYDKAHYPSFSSGSGYLMSRAAMTTIVETTLNLPYLKREDALFTGIIPSITRMAQLSMPYNTYILKSDDIKPDIFLKEKIVVAHELNRAMFLRGWSAMLQKQRNHTKGHFVKVVPRTDTTTELPNRWQLSRKCLKSRCAAKSTTVAPFLVRLQ